MYICIFIYHHTTILQRFIDMLWALDYINRRILNPVYRRYAYLHIWEVGYKHIDRNAGSGAGAGERFFVLSKSGSFPLRKTAFFSLQKYELRKKR